MHDRLVIHVSRWLRWALLVKSVTTVDLLLTMQPFLMAAKRHGMQLATRASPMSF